jgi:hypothetical protein
MGTKPNYDDVRTLNDPQFLHNWKLNIIKLPAVGTYPDPEAINWKCTTSDIPTASILNASVVVRGQTVHYPSGIVKYTETLNLNFIEDTDGTIKEFIRQWREVSGATRTGKSNKKANIEAIFELVNLDSEDADAWRITIYGCIFDNATLGSLESGANASIQSPVLTIKYDIFEDGKAT